MAGLKNIVRHWDGVNGSGQFRSKVVQQMIRESQQMPSEQVQRSGRQSQRRRLNPVAMDDAPGCAKRRLPPAWIPWLVALFLAVAAYSCDPRRFGNEWLRGSALFM